MRIRLSPQENRLVAQVIGVMEKVGYTEKRVKDQKATLRGTLRRGYAVLRTPEGRSSCVTLPSNLWRKKGSSQDAGHDRSGLRRERDAPPLSEG